jgi:hypothetical protein
MGKYNLTDELLEEGLSRGDIFEGVDEQGRQIFGLQTQTHVVFKEKADVYTTSRSKKLKANELSDAKIDFQSFSLTQFLILDRGVGAQEKPRSNPGASDLTKGEWEQAQAVLNQCKTEVWKYLQQLKDMLRDIGISKPTDHIYLTMTLASV